MSEKLGTQLISWRASVGPVWPSVPSAIGDQCHRKSVGEAVLEVGGLPLR